MQPIGSILIVVLLLWIWWPSPTPEEIDDSEDFYNN